MIIITSSHLFWFAAGILATTVWFAVWEIGKKKL